MSESKAHNNQEMSQSGSTAASSDQQRGSKPKKRRRRRRGSRSGGVAQDVEQSAQQSDQQSDQQVERGESHAELTQKNKRPPTPRQSTQAQRSQRPKRSKRTKKHPAQRRDSRSSEERLRAAVELIDSVAREEARELGVLRLSPLHVNLVVGDGERSDQAPSRELIARQVEKLKGQLQSQTRALVPTAFQRGTVYCFHRDEGISPPSLDSIFYGYDPLGRPLWTRMLPLFMSAQIPQLDRLYADPPEAVALLMSAPIGTLPIPEVMGGRVYEVLAQVVIGPIASHFGRIGERDERHTLTAQMILAQPPEHPLQVRFNLLGLDPDDLFDAAAKSAPRAPIARARNCITAARRAARKLQEQLSLGRLPRASLVQESEGLLIDLRDSLLRVLSGEPQRTRHAQHRHQSMERPTSEAWVDAGRAGAERLLWDNHQETIIVIGPKGRAHVFSEGGRHVTSMRLGVGEVERKLGQSRWSPLSPDRSTAFRALIRARQT